MTHLEKGKRNERLLELYKKGWSQTRLSGLISLSRARVCQIIHDSLGARGESIHYRRHLRQQRWEQMRQAISEGIPNKEVADKLGVSLWQVYDMAREAGCSVKDIPGYNRRASRPAKVKRNEELYSAYQKGATLTELSGDLGITRQRIYQIASKVAKARGE